MKRAVSCAAWICLILLFGAGQRPAVEWKEGEIWLTREGAPPSQLTADGCEKGREPVWSPDGAKVAYYTSETVDRPGCPTEVVLLSADGIRLKAIPALDHGNAVVGIGWLDNDRIGIDTHINPSLGQYRVVDVNTAKELAAYFGYWFTPSPDGKRVAHVGWIMHFAPPYAQSNYLQVENTTIYPLPRGSGPVEQKGLEDPPQVVVRHGVVSTGIHEFMPGLAWAADSQRIALVDCVFDWTAADEGALSAAGGRESNRRCSLAVVSVSGEASLFPLNDLSPDQLRQAKVAWIDPHQVRLQAGGLTKSIRIP